MKGLFLFPCNGNALEAINCIDSRKYNLIGFVDDTIEKQNKSFLGVQVFSREVLYDYKDALILAVPGSPLSYMKRKKIIDELGVDSKRFTTIIHPNATISPFAKIGTNVLIMSGVVITSNAIIGNHVCVLPNSVIHHDTIIKEYCLIGSNVTIASNSIVEKNCYIGSGTSVINGVSIGAYSLIGIASNVISNIPANSKVVGNPSRIIGNII